MGTAVACCEPSEEIHTSALESQPGNATNELPTTKLISDYSLSQNFKEQDANLIVGDKLDEIAVSDTKNKEVVAEDHQGNSESEEEETKG